MQTTTALRSLLGFLHVLARLGLRAGEVAALRLSDIDWRAGELRVRGKGRRTDRMPLPTDVGEEIARYLRDGRPRASRSAPSSCERWRPTGRFPPAG